MQQFQTYIHIGTGKPQFRLWHISDTHLCLCDRRNDQRKQELAAHRTLDFPLSESDLQQILQLKKEKEGLIVHTGDLIDFTSEANYDRAKQFVRDSGCFCAAGNHEFSQYVGEAWEDEAYRNQSLEKTQACFENNIRFDSKIVNGVNLVAVDNSYYLFELWQFERLKTEAEKGYPIVLLLHVPLYEENLYRITTRNGGDAALTAVPVEWMSHYTDHRFRQQKADETTLETVGYIKSHPIFKAILCGHLHFDFEGMVTPTLPQYGVGMGQVREVLID